MEIAEMLPKETILNAIRDMPEKKLSIEALLDRILFLYNIEEGVAQSLRGAAKTANGLPVGYQNWSKEGQAFYHDMKEAFEQVELHRQGKLRLPTFDEMMAEL